MDGTNGSGAQLTFRSGRRSHRCALYCVRCESCCHPRPLLSCAVGPIDPNLCGQTQCTGCRQIMVFPSGCSLVQCTQCRTFSNAPLPGSYTCRCGLYVSHASSIPTLVCLVCSAIRSPSHPSTPALAPLPPSGVSSTATGALHGRYRFPQHNVPPRQAAAPYAGVASVPVVATPGQPPPPIPRASPQAATNEHAQPDSASTPVRSRKGPAEPPTQAGTTTLGLDQPVRDTNIRDAKPGTRADRSWLRHVDAEARLTDPSISTERPRVRPASTPAEGTQVLQTAMLKMRIAPQESPPQGGGGQTPTAAQTPDQEPPNQLASESKSEDTRVDVASDCRDDFSDGSTNGQDGETEPGTIPEEQPGTCVYGTSAAQDAIQPSRELSEPSTNGEKHPG